MPRKTWSSRRTSDSRHTGFNEAAARCRGKRGGGSRPLYGEAGFNEAAARCRGKHPAGAHVLPDPRASMRPRPDAAENDLGFET